MITSSRALFVGLTSFALAALGCAAHAPQEGESDPTTALDESAVAKGDGSCTGTSSFMPEGTKTWTDEKGEMRYSLPPGFYSFEPDGGGSFIMVAGGSITCTCTKGSGGCSPVSQGGKSYCLMGSSCSSCDKSTAKVVLDVASGVRFASPGEVKTLPSVDAAMFKIPMVRKGLQEFRASLARDAGVTAESLEDATESKLSTGAGVAASRGRAYVAVSIYGRLAAFSVPVAYAAARGLVAGGSVTCSCSAGTGCKYGSMLGAKYCDAGSCTKCTMNGAAFDATFDNACLSR